MAPAALANQLVEASVPVDAASGAKCDFYTELMATSFGNKQQSNPSCQMDQTAGAGQRVQVPTTPPGVSNCYVFKSLLQEYAQKVGLPTPVYQTIREGPSHQPYFTSTVLVGGDRYDSLPGFLNRKAAEQSAAEVALIELSKCGESKEPIFVPVHETGLCKNLLQDYTQKMNYALPTYTCKRDDAPGKTLPFSCTVEIGGIRYIGAAAKTKKEAEIKAARTALLAIRSSPGVGSENLNIKSQYTVVPPKRKEPDSAPSQAPEKPKKKPKRSRLKKKRQNRRHPGDVGEHIQPENMDVLAVNGDTGTPVAVEHIQNCSDDHVPDHGQTLHSLSSSAQDFTESSNMSQHDKETSIIEGGSVPQDAGYLQQCDGNINSGVSLAPLKDANREPGVADAVSIIIDSPPCHQMDVSVSDICQRESGANREPSVTDVTFVRTDPPCSLSHHRDTSVSISMISQGESDAIRTPSVTDIASEKTDSPPSQQMDPSVSDPRISQGKSDASKESGVADVASMITDPPPSQQMDASVPDPGISQGEPAPALPDSTIHRREVNIAATNVAPNVAPLTSDPLPTQELEASVLEIGQEEPAPAVADRNYEMAENAAATNLAPIISDPLPTQEFDSSVSETEIDREDSAPAMATDPNYEREENDGNINSGVSSAPLTDANKEADPIITDPSPSQQMDVSVPDPRICQGEPAHALPDTTNHQRGENTAATNVAPVTSDPPPIEELEASISQIGQETSTVGDQNHERAENTAATNFAPIGSDSPPT